MDNTRGNLSVNYGLWVTVMCPCRLTTCNTYRLVGGRVDKGDAVNMGGGVGVDGKSPPLLNFAVSLKLALEKQT